MQLEEEAYNRKVFYICKKSLKHNEMSDPDIILSFEFQQALFAKL